MHIEDFIEAAEAYSDLGWAVQEQLRNLIDRDYSPGSLNKNAVVMIRRFAESLPASIDDYELINAVEDYLALDEDDEDIYNKEIKEFSL